ncbi:MAG: beta-lactamase family protein [Lachnospiraceae bacterium]|nr:beta-lactamase family protein [Lachnospiraceae bacterium]
MGKLKRYKNLLFATLIFCVADIFKMTVLFGNMLYMDVRTLADWLGILEIFAAALMVGEMAKTAKAAKNRFYYMPMLCYLIYAFYLATKVFTFSGALYSLSGNDILKYYKMYLMVAELCIGIRMMYCAREKRERVCGIGLIAINAFLLCALRMSYGISLIGEQHAFFAGIFFSTIFTISHLLVLLYLDKLRKMECQKREERETKTKQFLTEKEVSAGTIVGTDRIVSTDTKLKTETGLKAEGKKKSGRTLRIGMGLRATGTMKSVISCILILAFVLQGCSAVKKRVDEVTVSQDEAAESGNKDFLADDGRTLEQRIKDYIHTVSDDSYNGSVLITYGDKVLYEEAFGYANAYASLDRDKYNTKDQLYNIGGTTRQFTAAAILLLKEKGLINLDDTLDCYLKGYRYGSEVTIRQLLNQASGIPDYTDVMGKVKDILQYIYGQDMIGITANIDGRHTILRLLNSFPLSNTPGEVNETSASNYYLLGMVIEEVSGMEYTDYIKENIVKPLGMSDSTFDISDCRAYAYDGANTVSIYSPYLTYADTGFCSTVQDMLKWQNGLFGGKILSEQSLAEMLTVNEVSDMGYGWRSNKDGYYYLTCDKGFYTYQYVQPEKDLHVMVLFNTFNGVGMKVLIDMTDYIVQYLEEGGVA